MNKKERVEKEMRLRLLNRAMLNLDSNWSTAVMLMDVDAVSDARASLDNEREYLVKWIAEESAK